MRRKKYIPKGPPPSLSGKGKKAPIKKTSTLMKWVKGLLEALLIALLIRATIVEAFRIPTESMMPTLYGDNYYDKDKLSKNKTIALLQRYTYKVGDRIFVNKFIYGIRIPFTDFKIPLFKPKRGDVIVFIHPNPAERGKHLVKRCIGLPGEIIHIVNKKVYINGVELKEPYAIYIKNGLTYGEYYGKEPLYIPKGHYFVLGDNRDVSSDSRYWGLVPERLIRGKAMFVWWPPNRIKWIR